MQKKHLLAVPLVAAVAGVAYYANAPHASLGAQVTIKNETGASAHVYVSFGADSVVKAEDWKSFCTVRAPLNCDFDLAANSSQVVGGRGKYLNATISFNGQGCNSTKAELNVSNPKWFNVMDVSLVDGYSNKVKIVNTDTKGRVTTLGPPAGQDGNENIMGVFPYGCDICVAREHPPCGIVPGGKGCHGGTQFNPVPVCQWQGPERQDDSNIVVSLVN